MIFNSDWNFNKQHKFNCLLKNAKSSEVCEIYKKDTEITKTDFKDFDLSGFKKETITYENISPNKYLIVKLTSPKNINAVLNKKITVKQNESDDSNIATLKIISPLHVIKNSWDNSIIDKPVILY